MEIRALRAAMAAGLLFLVGCGDGTIGSGLEQILPYPRTHREGRRLFVAASDYRTGRLDIVPLADGLPVYRAMSIHQDSVVRSPATGLYDYVIGRTPGSLRFVDKKDGTVKGELGLGAGCNLQDVLPVTAGEALVTCLAEDTIRRVSLATGETGARVALSPQHRVPGQKPGLALMAPWKDGKVLVEVWRLLNGMSPSDASYVLIVDPRRNLVVQDVRLARTNPVTELKRGPDGSIYVGEAGFTGHVSRLDGGIERFDAETMASRGLVAEETDLGGDIIDFEILDEERGVAIVSTPKTKLVKFRMAGGGRRATGVEVLLESAGFDLEQIVLDREAGEFYVADKNRRPGIHVFRVATLEKLRTIPMTLPPYRMELMR